MQFDCRALSNTEVAHYLHSIPLEERGENPIALVTQPQFDGYQEFCGTFGATEITNMFMGFELLVC